MKRAALYARVGTEIASPTGGVVGTHSFAGSRSPSTHKRSTSIRLVESIQINVLYFLGETGQLYSY